MRKVVVLCAVVFFVCSTISFANGNLESIVSLYKDGMEKTDVEGIVKEYSFDGKFNIPTEAVMGIIAGEIAKKSFGKFVQPEDERLNDIKTLIHGEYASGLDNDLRRWNLFYTITINGLLVIEYRLQDKFKSTPKENKFWIISYIQ